MNRVAKALLPVVILAAVSVSAQEEGFGRYQVILDRKPFGDLPPPPVNQAPPGPPPVSFAQSLRLSMIIENDDGSIKIGFVDTRSGKSYSLGAGESEDGIEVVSASFADEEAVLRQGAEMALMKLQSGEVRTITPGDQAQMQQNQGQNPPQASAPSYIERRRLRAMESQPEPPPPPKYTGEELAKHLQEYQMEVIRQGLPPLPIPLTPDQDAQLVKEGILPPAP